MIEHNLLLPKVQHRHAIRVICGHYCSYMRASICICVFICAHVSQQTEETDSIHSVKARSFSGRRETEEVDEIWNRPFSGAIWWINSWIYGNESVLHTKYPSPLWFLNTRYEQRKTQVCFLCAKIIFYKHWWPRVIQKSKSRLKDQLWDYTDSYCGFKDLRISMLIYILIQCSFVYVEIVKK